MARSLLFLIAFVSVSAAASSAAQFDPPDLNLEYRLHQQYLKSVEPSGDLQTSPGLIENYEVQSGDSLWNLSQLLYGDGNYWPKVWAQNQNITNPHLVRKGHVLEFRMGSEDDTPAFRFSEGGDNLELTAANGNGNGNPQIQIPPPEIPPKPVLRVPPSFPQWQTVFRSRKDIQIDDSHMVRQVKSGPERIPLQAFASDSEIEPSGMFLEVEKESGLPVANQYVYVKIKKGIGAKGQKYLIVKDHGRIHRMNDQVDHSIKTHFVQIYGEIELSEMVDPSTANVGSSYDAFRALITHATDLALAEYQLIPGQLENVDLGQTGPMGTSGAQIIGSYKHEASALYGTGDIVFLDHGSKDGLEPGQLLNIYIDRTIRDAKTPFPFSSVPSGLVKIVKVDQECATAVILRTTDSIQQGDKASPQASMAPSEGSSSVTPSEGGSDDVLPPAPENQDGTPAPSDDDLQDPTLSD